MTNEDQKGGLARLRAQSKIGPLYLSFHDVISVQI